ncbi:amidohydrolase [Burkholderia guangdongensis]|uniref:amidohydrolase n=1 Tax=Burkholderia guangdongensis TaxID=1792500 RepID=UPI0015CE7BB6|nr:amidohydrolase [Burkholderia guangdongensis]
MIAIDSILHGGRIFTAVRGQPLQQAIAIGADGKIVAVGADRDVLPLAQPHTRVIDLGGKVAMPGLLDSHAHALRGGLQQRQASFDGQTVSLVELERQLLIGVGNGSALRDDVVVLGGVPVGYWSRIGELERRFNDGAWAARAVLLVGFDYHTGWANGAMLKLAQVSDAAPGDGDGDGSGDHGSDHSGDHSGGDHSGGDHSGDDTIGDDNIGRHDDGRPNGFLAEGALWSAIERLPPLPMDQLLEGARDAIRHYHGLGVTGWMDPVANDAPGSPLTNASVGVLPVYKTLAERGELTVHVAALLMADAQATPSDLDELAAVRAQFDGVPNLTVPGIKIFADGVVEYPTQTAALLAPYANSGECGELLIDPAHFGTLVDAADARGWLVHVHAIGDRAVRESLNGIEHARRARRSGIPHSITHLQIVHPDDWPRFRALDVIASMQLFWAKRDADSVDLVQPYVDAHAYAHQYPARSLVAHGATLAGASDWPISTPDPWQAMYQAVTRVGAHGVLNAAECVDRDTMFYAYTIHAARAMRIDDRTGSLEAGKQADLIVVDRDVFDVDHESLRDTRVLATFFAGKLVFAQGFDGADTGGFTHDRGCPEAGGGIYRCLCAMRFTGMRAAG